MKNNTILFLVFGLSFGAWLSSIFDEKLVFMLAAGVLVIGLIYERFRAE